MKVLILGATGMVGHGVLRECLLADDVTQVVSIGRSGLAQQHPKLVSVVHADLFDLAAIEAQLRDVDACFFCLGVSSVGMSEADYRRQTLDLTLSIAQALARVSPQACFVYVSGTGTDSSEKGGSMWARVKGRTENELMRLPFRSAFMFRPGVIQPLNGARSKVGWIHAFYVVLGPVLSGLRALFPRSLLSTEVIGRAMLAAARGPAARRVAEPADIFALSQEARDGR